MLKLVFLGHQDVFLDGVRLDLSGKPLAMLAYLLIEGREVARDDLALRLWSRLDREGEDEYRERAFTQFRGAGGLLRLRNLGLTGRYIIEEKRLLRFRADDPEQHPVELDFGEYQPSQKWAAPEAREAAFARYEGDFLSGLRFYRDELGETHYAGWLNQKRDDFRAQYIRLLEELIASDMAQNQPDVAVERVNRALRLMPSGTGKRLMAQRQKVRRYQIALLALTGDLPEARAAAETVLREAARERNIDVLEAFKPLAQLLDHRSPDTAALLRLLPGDQARTVEVPAVPPFQAFRRPDVFILRDEVQTALDLLTDPSHAEAGSCPIVALVGMGGAGKSTLATHLAHTLKEQSAFPDGILWGDFASYDLRTILMNWIKDLHPTSLLQGDLAAQFRQLTATRRCLVVLEDIGEQFDTPQQPEERRAVRDSLIRQIRQILPNNHESTVLIATRDMELANGLNASIVELKEFTPPDALRLLAACAGEQRITDEADTARSICVLLEHLPLALELAGQTIKTRRMPLADYERMLLARPMLPRVERSFEISWQMLGDDDDARQLFAQLAVFETRDFDLPAVQAVTTLDPYVLQDRLYELTALSLVREIGAGRYRLHRLMAAFARAKLATTFAALEAETRRRCFDYYLAFAEQHRDAFDRLTAELAHFQPNLQHAAQADPGKTARYVRALEKFWLRRGYVTEARQGYATAIEATADPAERAYLLTGLAYMETDQAEYAAAQAHLQEAEAYYRKQYEPAGLARVLEYQGRRALYAGELERVDPLLQEAGDIYEEISDFEGMAAALVLRADVPYLAGDYEAAKKLANLALEYVHRGSRFVTVEQRPGAIQVYRVLLDAAVQQQDFEAARRYYDICIRLCDEADNIDQRALVLYMWGSALRFMGELDEADEAIQRSERVMRQTGNLLTLARVFKVRSAVERDRKNWEVALHYSRESVILFERLGQKDEWHESLVREAGILWRMSRFREACIRLDEASRLAEQYQLMIPDYLINAIKIVGQDCET